MPKRNPNEMPVRNLQHGLVEDAHHNLEAMLGLAGGIVIVLVQLDEAYRRDVVKYMKERANEVLSTNPTLMRKVNAALGIKEEPVTKQRTPKTSKQK